MQAASRWLASTALPMLFSTGTKLILSDRVEAECASKVWIFLHSEQSSQYKVRCSELHHRQYLKSHWKMSTLMLCHLLRLADASLCTPVQTGVNTVIVQRRYILQLGK